jgi:hypothetical protein
VFSSEPDRFHWDLRVLSIGSSAQHLTSRPTVKLELRKRGSA